MKVSVLNQLVGAAKKYNEESMKELDNFCAALVEFSLPSSAVRSPVFRAGFAKSIPKGMLNPSAISQHKMDLGKRVRDAVGEHMRGDDITLLLDASSLHKRRLLSYTVVFKGVSRFCDQQRRR